MGLRPTAPAGSAAGERPVSASGARAALVLGAWLAFSLGRAPALRAEDRPGRGAASFLRLAQGARASALGEAYTAAADDPSALYWNPAALGPLRTPGVSLDHLFHYDQTRVDALSASFPTLWGGVAVGSRWFTGPDIARYRNGVAAGRFTAWERTGELAAAVGKRTVSVGFAGRYYQAAVDRKRQNALLADAGILASFRRGRYRFGAAAQNMGNDLGYGSSEDLKGPPPRTWRLGTAWRPGKSALVAYDHAKPQNRQAENRFGVELWAMPALAFRAGYLWQPRRERNVEDALAAWRFGTGLKVAGCDVDYAYAPGHTLGDAHHVTLSFRFAAATVLEEAGRLTLTPNPADVSPDGDGRQDTSFLQLGLQGLQNVARWSVEARNAQSRRVWRAGGRGAPPGLVEWTGRTERGEPLPDGEYVVQARVWASQSQSLSSPVRVRLDSTPPQASVRLSTAVISPDGDGADDELVVTVRASDRSAPLRWSMEIRPTDGAAAAFSATGTFSGAAATASWRGEGNASGALAPNGLYRVDVMVSDAAGNEARPPAEELRVEAGAEAVLKSIASDLSPVAVPGGYRVEVPSARVFDSADGVSVSTESAAVRSRLLALAKAFPDHRLVVNGRIGSRAGAKERLELSSAQAWALYSALVKAGLEARRLEVHGLGGARGSKNRLEVLLLQPEPPPVPAGPSILPTDGTPSADSPTTTPPPAPPVPPEP
jgi:hypothetical protein